MLYRIFIVLFTMLPGIAAAQGVKGIVVDGITGNPVAAVSVVNSRTGQSGYTDANGSFSIPAAKDDPIVFSMVGYRTQQKIVPASIGMAQMHIDFFPLSYELDEFTFRRKYSPYQLDSMERKATYKRALAREKSATIMNPVTLLADKLSRKSKQLYRFQKSFYYWEDLKFVEFRYTPELVAQMTPLRGDTIAAFMNAHPLPYEFARVASDLELKMWIRDQYKIWRQRPRYEFLLPAADTATAP